MSIFDDAGVEKRMAEWTSTLRQADAVPMVLVCVLPTGEMKVLAPLDGFNDMRIADALEDVVYAIRAKAGNFGRRN
jgi:hypothetical protein